MDGFGTPSRRWDTFDPTPPIVDYEYEIWPLFKEPTEEAVEHTRSQLHAGVNPVAGSCRCGGGCSVPVYWKLDYQPILWAIFSAFPVEPGNRYLQRLGDGITIND